MVRVKLILLVLVNVEGVVVGEDVLLNGFVHMSADCKEVLRVVFVLGHLFDSRAIP